MTQRGQNAKSARPVKPAPDLETPVALELKRRGWTVITESEVKKHVGGFSGVIVRQHIPRCPDVDTGRPRMFRLDYAHLPSRVALEVDGYNRHNPKTGKYSGKGGHITWDGFHNDRHRDRCLTLDGWRVLRCGPGDLKGEDGPPNIVNQFEAMIQGVMEGKTENKQGGN